MISAPLSEMSLLIAPRAAAYFVLKGVDELGLELDTVNTDDFGVLSDKDHHVLDVTESRDVGSDDIAGDRFITAINIVGGERRLERVADSLPVLWKSTSPLRGVVVRVMDGIHVGKGEELAIGLKVAFGRTGMRLATEDAIKM
jgi:hypothetical protein